MSPDFGWDTVLYTIDRPSGPPSKGASCADGKQAVISGPFQPEVRLLTGHYHTCI